MKSFVLFACMSFCTLAQGELNDINCNYDFGNDDISFSLEVPDDFQSKSITLKHEDTEIAHVVISTGILSGEEYQMSLFFRDDVSGEFILDSAASLYNDQRSYSLYSWDGADVVRRLVCEF